jgi:ribosome-associated toxin RatA of RatAB toxin-antitoxin module
VGLGPVRAADRSALKIPDGPHVHAMVVRLAPAMKTSQNKRDSRGRSAYAYCAPVLAAALAVCTLSGTAHAERSVSERLTTPTIAVTTLPYPNTSVEWGRAEGVVDAPIDTVFTIVRDYGRYATFLPNFQASRVLSKRGDNALVYLEAKIIKKMVTIWAEMKLAARVTDGNVHVVEGKMMKGNVSIMAARWELTPVDAGRTKVAFQLIMDPGIPMPSSVITYFGAKATRQTIQALQKRVTSPALASR